MDARIRVLPFEWRKRRTTKAPAKQKPVAWRFFTHPDGRRWAIAGLNNRVCIRGTDSDGDVHERQTPAKDVQVETSELIASQIAEGFVEDEATQATSSLPGRAGGR